MEYRLTECGNVPALAGCVVSSNVFRYRRVLRHVCLKISNTSKKNATKRIASLVQGFIELKRFVQSLAPFQEALEKGSSTLFDNAKAPFRKDASLCNDILEILSDTLEENLKPTHTAFLNRTQQCFAIKQGVCPMLELCRAEFSEATEAVHALANRLREEYNLPSLSVQYTEQRGFYFCLAKGLKRSADDHDAQPPGDMTVLMTTAAGAQYTTDALNALNARIREASDDCLRLTERILDDKFSCIVGNHLPGIRNTLDAIGCIDVVASLAVVASSATEFVAPIFTETGPFVIQKGRHPIVEKCLHRFEANDTWLGPDSQLHVISGPNMSGKTTYLKQLGVLVVMAQLGSLVPASFMSLTPFKDIAVRMCTEDTRMEQSMSSFVVEMMEMKNIICRAGRKCLILIDELGRSTSYADGLSISWAIAEHLCMTQAYVVITTHFSELCKLPCMYPQCSSFHFCMDTDRYEEKSKCSTHHVMI